MDTTLGKQGLALPRVFAGILFLLAAVIGLPMALILAVSLVQADLRGLGIAAAVASVAAGLGWLGSVLWSGRPIPRWFMMGFGLFLFGVPVAAVVARGTWKEVAAILGMLLSTAWPFWSALRAQPPGKPEPFDDLA
ncbi:hypothetical protein OJF2_36600 [Aquisphaera giovannonii]|uniref:Uncharacterized protein n=1 Tax=Aquisphaera giovannonii TaxID=406548 RepID=A0A5B9W4Q9_9BACT|nr:hypothetical protein [Aquisphaera giovannonii]QEH35115.1 hypothetical protein OJF2_36600 [Aquisphaera giovannonii]